MQPEILDLVRIRVAGSDVELHTRVEDVAGYVVHIAVPSTDVGEEAPDIDVGTALTIEWITPRGLARFDGVVTERQGGAVPVLIVQWPGRAQVIQRRDYVRIDTSVGFELEHDGVTVDGITVDLSGGGLRGRVAAPLKPGDEVKVTLDLPDEAPVSATAEVVRVLEEGLVYTFKFRVIKPRDHDRLIGFVFERHRKMFALEKRP